VGTTAFGCASSEGRAKIEPRKHDTHCQPEPRQHGRDYLPRPECVRLPDAVRSDFREGAFLVAVATAATAAAAGTAISTIATPTTAATASAALGLGTCLIDVDRAPANLRTVQTRNRLFPVFIAGHLHESEAAGAAGVAVGHDAYPVDLSVRFKKLPQFLFVGVEAEIPHENILQASASALSCRKCKLSSADLAGRVGRS